MLTLRNQSAKRQMSLHNSLRLRTQILPFINGTWIGRLILVFLGLFKLIYSGLSRIPFTPFSRFQVPHWFRQQSLVCVLSVSFGVIFLYRLRQMRVFHNSRESVH